MTRKAKRLPGWDCIRKPCGKSGCGEHMNANHGAHNDMWEFAVIDGDVAIHLVVDSGVYPETVPLGNRGRQQPEANYLWTHHSFPILRGDVLSDGNSTCAYLKPCFGGDGSSEAARRLFEKHFVTAAGFDQPGSFWEALEHECAEAGKLLRARRVDDKYARCPHCSGTGIIDR